MGTKTERIYKIEQMIRYRSKVTFEDMLDEHVRCSFRFVDVRCGWKWSFPSLLMVAWLAMLALAMLFFKGCMVLS